MPTTITMPQLGETVTEGTVAQWLKQVGDAVEKYEAFVEVSTDKVNAEVPSPVSGTIRELIVKEGETVATGAPIAIIDEVGAATQASTAPSPSAAPPVPVPSSYGASGDSPATVPSGMQPNGAQPSGARQNGVHNSPETLQRVSPAVRRLAREHHIDLRALTGTGEGGRITANDVLAAAHEGPAAVVAATIRNAPEPLEANRVGHTPASSGNGAPPSGAPANGTSAGANGTGAATGGSGSRSTYTNPLPGETVPLTQARKIIAQRMVESKHTAPHAWTMVEVDVTNLWRWRNREKDRFAAERGVPLTLLPFFMRAVVESIAKFPLMNARFTDEGIFVHREVNLGIAVALNANLMVPVVRAADTLSIAGLALEAGRIIEKARAGKLTADDLGGGTFTVNNTGANGSVLSAPIINGGQAGIITMEAVVKRPVVVEGDAIAVRSMMNVCLSLDHRVIDGAIASAFLLDLKKRLQAMGPDGTL